VKRTRQRVIKKAIWEVRYDTRLSFYDRAGSLLQEFLDWEDRRFFARWTYGPDEFGLENAGTATHFAVGPKRAAASTENLLPLGGYGPFCGRVKEFLSKVTHGLGVPALTRVGQRLQYLIDARQDFQAFAAALTGQLTRLGDYQDIDACRAEDMTLTWISKHDDPAMSMRWVVGPLRLDEFPRWFSLSSPAEGGPSDERQFYPGVSLLVDVDASRKGRIATDDMLGFFEPAFTYVDQRVAELAQRLRES